jgi:zinc protease
MTQSSLLSRGLAAALLLWPLAAFGQVPNWPVESPPRPLAARDVKFPPYEIRTLANGLKVVVVQHPEQPVISLRLIVRVGAAADPAGKQGLAAMTAALLDQGTMTRNAQQIADTIDSIGGGLGAGAGSDLTFATVVVMKDSFGFGLDLLSDIVRNPGFRQEELDRQRQQALSSLKVSYEDPDYVAGLVFDRLVYGFHPYGLPNSGTPSSLGSLTVADLRAFHRRHFVANNAILAVVGDTTAPDAFAAVERAFGGWARAELPPAPFSDPPPATRRVVVVNKPDAVQTEVRVGHIAIPRKHQDFLAFDLAVKILGGEGANRLQRVLRSERGLTYGASADTQALLQTGDFSAETDTRSEATGEVLRVIVDEIMRIQRERVSPRELADAQAYLSGNFPLTIETPDAIAAQVLNALFYDLPLSDLETYRERVNAITPDDIQRVAKAYLRPERLSVVLVGNVKAFGGQLAGVGFDSFEQVELADLDLTTANFRRARAAIGSGKPGPQLARLLTRPWPYAERAGVQALAADVRTLLDRAIAARGGLERLKGVQTMIVEAKSLLTTRRGQLTAESRTYVQYPDRVRVEARLPMAEVVQVYNAGEVWVKDPSGVHEPRGRVKDELRDGLERDISRVLVGAAEGRLPARPLPDAKDADGSLLRALEITPPVGSPMVLHFHAASFEVVRSVYEREGRAGVAAVEESFSDYRPVDGLRLPFHTTVRRGSVTVADRSITELKINPAIDPALFARPQ